MTIWPQLIAREGGELVVVEPLAPEHEEGHFAAGQDPGVWTYLTAFPYAAQTRQRFGAWMEQALAESTAGREGAFAIIDRQSGTPIGSTRYLALRPEHRGLEIGWTWLGRAWWRTGANVECKLLLLGRAFETLGCERVELKTDARNARSRAAMEALPAQFEGIHRRHMKIPDGWRDTAWYSVIAPEWPTVPGSPPSSSCPIGCFAGTGVAARWCTTTPGYQVCPLMRRPPPKGYARSPGHQ